MKEEKVKEEEMGDEGEGGKVFKSFCKQELLLFVPNFR